jgi:two-component system response regulator YesN
MFNILIVDDQKHICDGLVTMLQQFSLPIGSIHEAGNGVEALRILHEHSIQLVITDIKMPDMDGLELMARTREERIEVDYLIISGYGEFAYAQRAIELGAKGYLLKPVKREDLQASIDHVLQEMRTRRELLKNMQDISRRAEDAERKELRLFMKGEAVADDWIHEVEPMHAQLWSHYRLVMLREERWIHQPGAPNIHGLESIAYRVYGGLKCLCLQRHPQLILACAADLPPDALLAALQSEQFRAVAIMTDPVQGLKQLPEAYRQLLELYRHSCLFPEQRCLLPTHIEGLEQQWQLPYEDIYALFQLMGTDNDGLIAEYISKIFQKKVLQRYHINYTVQLCRALVDMIDEYERVIRPYIGEGTIDIDCLRNLFDYPGMRDYIQALQQQLLSLNQHYYELKCSYRNSQDLNEAIRYIHANYHKPLDLAMVSNHVSLNYAYFSNLFKKNVGKSFAEYLRDVRLDKARKLLVDTDYKVADIASMVGYENYKSFTRVFREVMRMQPTEYRQRMRRMGTGKGNTSSSAL